MRTIAKMMALFIVLSSCSYYEPMGDINANRCSLYESGFSDLEIEGAVFFVGVPEGVVFRDQYCERQYFVSLGFDNNSSMQNEFVSFITTGVGPKYAVANAHLSYVKGEKIITVSSIISFEQHDGLP